MFSSYDFVIFYHHFYTALFFVNESVQPREMKWNEINSGPIDWCACAWMSETMNWGKSSKKEFRRIFFFVEKNNTRYNFNERRINVWWCCFMKECSSFVILYWLTLLLSFTSRLFHFSLALLCVCLIHLILFMPHFLLLIGNQRNNFIISIMRALFLAHSSLLSIPSEKFHLFF